MYTRSRSSVAHRLPGRATRPFVVAVACAAFVAATPVAAQAQYVADPDTVGDMAVISFGEEEQTFVPAPERTLNDVSQATLTHGARRVTVRVDYVDLKKVADEYQGLYIAVVTDEGVRRGVSVESWRRHWSGEAYMEGGGRRNPDCQVRHSIDYEANVMQVGFPRRCASNPDWVTFRVGAYAMSEEAVYIDDALRDSTMTVDDERLARSEPVYAGEVAG